MNKTGIEWTDYTVNPLKGKCKMGCSYCYARKRYDRFKWNPEMRLDLDAFIRGISLYSRSKPCKIFVCSMYELFGKWVPYMWIRYILAIAEQNPKHTFQILTKNPGRAKKFDYPDNVWLGMTITGKESKGRQWHRLESLFQAKATIKFFSFEPLLAEPGDYNWESADWVIIGAQTNPYKAPKREWVESLVWYCDFHSTPVFLKNNLKPLMGDNLRQEFPKL